MPAERYEFGKNWSDYVARNFSDERVEGAKGDLLGFLGLASLEGMTFLDVGCGSGLHSLAALRAGARRVVSFDYDADSVATTRRLHEHAGSPAAWEVSQGSALDRDFMASLPASEVVYAWGVLHHTGDMALAFENTCGRVAPGGLLHTAIYNRTWTSPAWRVIKRAYNHRGRAGRLAMHGSFFAWNAVARAAGLKHPFRRERGMSVWYDAVDWLGGYPYEYATHDEVVATVNRHGRFELVKSRRDPGFGCNEFLFRRAG